MSRPTFTLILDVRRVLLLLAVVLAGWALLLYLKPWILENPYVPLRPNIKQPPDTCVLVVQDKFVGWPERADGNCWLDDMPNPLSRQVWGVTHRTTSNLGYIVSSTGELLWQGPIVQEK